MNEDHLITDLATADLDLVGHLTDASNAALLVQLRPTNAADFFALYKPISGERPLWDFPDGFLAHREVAAYLISAAGGWDVVPPTMMRQGPLGPGSVQLWVTPVGVESDTDEQTLILADGTPSAQDVVLAPPAKVPAGFLPVLTGQLADGTGVVVAHADSPELAAVAVFDAVLNNSDRKGSHLLRDGAGRLWGVDHGVSLHQQEKLRTVLWGWRGRPLPDVELNRVRCLHQALQSDETLIGDLATLLTPREIDALQGRVTRLLSAGTFPQPGGDWPAVPWPPL